MFNVQCSMMFLLVKHSNLKRIRKLKKKHFFFISITIYNNENRIYKNRGSSYCCLILLIAGNNYNVQSIVVARVHASSIRLRHPQNISDP